MKEWDGIKETGNNNNPDYYGNDTIWKATIKHAGNGITSRPSPGDLHFFLTPSAGRQTSQDLPPLFGFLQPASGA